MIICHPKKIPKFLLKGGVVQFCHLSLRKVLARDVFFGGSIAHAQHLKLKQVNIEK